MRPGALVERSIPNLFSMLSPTIIRELSRTATFRGTDIRGVSFLLRCGSEFVGLECEDDERQHIYENELSSFERRYRSDILVNLFCVVVLCHEHWFAQVLLYSLHEC